MTDTSNHHDKAGRKAWALDYALRLKYSENHTLDEVLENAAKISNFIEGTARGGVVQFSKPQLVGDHLNPFPSIPDKG